MVSSCALICSLSANDFNPEASSTVVCRSTFAIDPAVVLTIWSQVSVSHYETMITVMRKKVEPIQSKPHFQIQDIAQC